MAPRLTPLTVPVAISLTLVAHVLSAHVSTVLAQAPRPLTLDAAIGYALDNAPALQGERLRTAFAKTQNDLALSAWRPQLAIDASGQHFFQQPVSIVPDFSNPESGETRVVTIGARNTSALGATASQLLFSPEVLRDRRLREPLVESAELAVAEIVRDLRADVSVAFYETLRAVEALRLAEQDIARLERSLRDAELRSENGLDSKVPRLRARIALNAARARAERAAEALESRRAELAQLLGYEADAAALEPAYDFDVIRVGATSTERPALLPSRRAEVRRLQADRAAQALRVDYARRSWWPTVSLSAGYDLNWQDNELAALYGRTFRSSYGAFAARLPLYRGGARGHEIELARITETQLERRLQAVTNQIEAEYAVADNDLSAALAALEAAEANRELAREVYEVVRLQYREGITPYLDVVIAENDLQAARNLTLDATVDAAIARVRLRRAAGTL